MERMERRVKKGRKEVEDNNRKQKKGKAKDM